MNYQVLARKWRPQRFTEVVGQQHVLTALVNALAQGRLHHAYLFSGTRGVGKTSIARLLAKALNCDKGITPEPCGECSSCVEIEQGRFVDLLEIDAASRTKVEDTRELLDNVQYQPARGRFKVYLIDEVHMLSRHSFNALLKTLEEPPPHVKFLLATTDPQKLPITILSRCLQFHLKSLEPEQIDGQLQHILRQEQLPFEVEATAALARAADGSVRDALSLTDQALAFGNGEIRLSQVEAMLGNLNHNQLMSLVNALLSGDGGAMLAQVSNLASMGPDYDHIHKELVGFWHQLAMAQIVPAPALLPYASELNRLAPLISPEQIQLYYQICLQGRKDLPFAADGRAALEMTLLRTLAFQPSGAIAAEALTASRAAETAVKKPEPPRIAPSSSFSSSTAEIAPAVIAPPAPAMAAAAVPNEVLPAAASMTQPEAFTASAAEGTALDAMLNAELNTELNVGSNETDAQWAAQLNHEQDTILTQAAQFGYQGAQPEQGAPESSVSVAAHVSAADRAEPVLSEPVFREPVFREPVPAASAVVAMPAAATASAQMPPVPTASVQAAPIAAPPVTLPAQAGADETAAELIDPAAASVAKIRLLLQTRNRLRSQELEVPDHTPVQRGPASAANASQPVASSYVPPARTPVAQALKTPPVQGQALRTENSAHSSPAPVTARVVSEGQSHQGSKLQGSELQGSELPPLDAYSDLGAQQDDDDAPPWSNDDSGFDAAPWQPSTAPAAISTTRMPTPAPVARPSVPATRVAAAPLAAPVAPAVGATGGLSAMAGLRSGPSQTATDPEPLKPSSLLVQATDTWTALVAQLPLGGLLRQLAMHSSLEQQSAHQWQLWLNPAHRHLLNDKACAELAEVVSEQQQAAITLQVQVGEQAEHLTPFDIEQQLYQNAISQAKDEIERDDAVQFLISRFAAELDRDSIEPMAQ